MQHPGNLLTIIMMVVVLNLLPATGILSQTVSPNIRLNDVIDVDASTEGSRCITVVDDIIYTVWSDKREGIGNIYFSKSTDGGENFLSDVIVSYNSSTVNYAFPSIAVTSAGVIYIAWNKITGTSWDEYNICFTKSVDGGSTFLPQTDITTTNSFVYSSICADGDNVYIFYGDLIGYPLVEYYLVRSDDGGSSFKTPLKVNDAGCVASVEVDGVTSIAIDGSGNIYLTWIDGRRATGNGDIYFAKSTDNGVSISSNVMVNDILSAGVDAIQYKPKISLGATNEVYISFADKRLGDDWVDNRIYLSVSSDGGASFSPEVLLAGYDGICNNHDLMANNDKLSVVLYALFDVNWGIWLLESADGGSTFSTPVAMNDALPNDAGDPHIFLSSDGNAYVIWVDHRTGISDNAYFSRTTIVSNSDDISSGKSVVVYPNPTDDYFTIDLGSTFKNISLNILNIKGQVIHKQKNQDTQKLIIDEALPPGVYFINIEYDKKVTALKLIIN